MKTSSRRSNRGKIKTNILLSDISFVTTCIDLDLPITLSCDRCRSIKESQSGLLKKSSHQPKRFRDISERRRCQQPWASINGHGSKTLATTREFVRVRNYLSIDCDVEIEMCNTYNKSKKKNKQSHGDPSSRIINKYIPAESSPTATILQSPSDTTTSTVKDSNSASIQCSASDHTSESTFIPLTPALSSGPTSDHAAKPSSILITPALSSTPGHPSLPTTELPDPDTTQYNNSLYVPILKRKLKQLERDAALGQKIRQKLTSNSKQFTGTNIARRLYAMAAVHTPKLGLKTLLKNGTC